MSQLFAPVCSITATRRRRFLWAAWWTAPPARQPFRKPDASSGGARSRADALAEAEKAAGAPLIEIEADWARAWARVMQGEPAFPRGSAEPRVHRRATTPAPTNASVFTILGVTRHATAAELKSAYRQRARETHPDRGGTAEDFRRVEAAYQEASKRAARPRKRK